MHIDTTAASPWLLYPQADSHKLMSLLLLIMQTLPEHFIVIISV